MSRVGPRRWARRLATSGWVRQEPRGCAVGAGRGRRGEAFEGLAINVRMEELEGGEGLVWGRRADAGAGEVVQIVADGVGEHDGVGAAMKGDEAGDRLGVGALGAGAVVLQAKRGANAGDELRRIEGGHATSLGEVRASADFRRGERGNGGLLRGARRRASGEEGAAAVAGAEAAGGGRRSDPHGFGSSIPVQPERLLWSQTPPARRRRRRRCGRTGRVGIWASASLRELAVGVFADVEGEVTDGSAGRPNCHSA